jgi:adenylate kinase
VQISTGDILRGAVKEGTELGKQAEAFMDAGDLVPDELIMGIMKRAPEGGRLPGRLPARRLPAHHPPGRAAQGPAGGARHRAPGAVNLDVPREVILDRLTTRRTCVDCGAIYNVKSMPPKVEGVCDKCGGKVVQRDDETEEAISNRLDVYNQKTAPLVDFYRGEGLLLDVNATSSDAVVASIREHVGA